MDAYSSAVAWLTSCMLLDAGSYYGPEYPFSVIVFLSMCVFRVKQFSRIFYCSWVSCKRFFVYIIMVIETGYTKDPIFGGVKVYVSHLFPLFLKKVFLEH